MSERKINWSVIVSIAALGLTITTWLTDLNRLSIADARAVTDRINKAENKINILENKVATNEGNAFARTAFRINTARITEFLCNRDADCRRRYPPVEVPQ